MQPFLSGETTLALLLITLTLLLFAAAGDDHPYEPSYHRNFETKRSSVELDSRPPVPAEGLVVRLDALQQQQQQQQQQQGGKNGRVEWGESRTEVVKQRSIHKAPHNSKPASSSYLSSRLRPRNLQILVALLSHQSLLHTMSMPQVLKSDISWSLGGLRWWGSPLIKTVRRGRSLRSLRCQGKDEGRGVKYNGGGGGGGGGDDARRERSEDDKSSTGNGRVCERVVEVGD